MKKEEIKKFYEKYHENETFNPVVNFMQQERCNMLRSLLKDISGKILVIGCDSQDEMNIINKTCKATGIDLSKVAIKKSKEKYPEFEYYVANATNLPFPDNSFDYVVCSEVIEHISEAERALQEIRRVLKNGKTFIVTTPNWLSWYGLARKIAEMFLRKPCTAGDQPIDNWSTPFGLKKTLLKYNFNPTLVRGIWYYPPFGKGKKQIPWKVTLPTVKLLYPFEVLLRTIFPWFGHMILFKTRLIKSDDHFDYRYWRDRHEQKQGLLSTVGQRTYSDKANFYIYKLVKEQYDKLLNKIDLPKGSKILDGGCGIGLYIDLLLSKGYEVDAADISSDALIYLKEKNPLINIIAKPLFLLPDNKKYDAIHCFDVLYHILDDNEWRLTLKSFSKIARKYIILHERFLNKKPIVISNHIKFRSYSHLKEELGRLDFEECISIPTHFMSLRLLTYKINKFCPKFFYILDKNFFNILEKKNLAILANKFGSHHIKVFRKIK